MEHGANATELFAFVGGDRYGPPATTVRGIVIATARYGPSATTARLAPRQTLCTHPATLYRHHSLHAQTPHSWARLQRVPYCVCAQATRAAADMHASLAGRASSAAWRRRNATTAYNPNPNPHPLNLTLNLN